MNPHNSGKRAQGYNEYDRSYGSPPKNQRHSSGSYWHQAETQNRAVHSRPRNPQHTQYVSNVGARQRNTYERGKSLNSLVANEPHSSNDGVSKLYCFPSPWNHYIRESLKATWSIVKKVGHYSLDEKFVVKWDTSGVKFFEPSNCSSSTNLFDGYSDKLYVDKQSLQAGYENSHSISQLISWMKYNRHTIGHGVDFVVKHSTLKLLLLSTFEQRHFNLEAVLHDGVIYLDKPTNARKSFVSNKNRLRNMAVYSGSSFEKVVTRPGNPDSVQSARFYSVFDGELTEASVSLSGNNTMPPLRFIMSAEIDAVEGESLDAVEDLNNYIEIKSTSERYGGRNRPNDSFNRERVLNWWLHCYLAGIPRIFIGERTGDGSLVRTTLSPSFSIPGIADINDRLQPCMDIFLALFRWIKHNVTKEDIIYQVSYSRGRGGHVNGDQSLIEDKCFLELFSKACV